MNWHLLQSNQWLTLIYTVQLISCKPVAIFKNITNKSMHKFRATLLSSASLAKAFYLETLISVCVCLRAMQAEERAKVGGLPDGARPQSYAHRRLQRHSLPEGRRPGVGTPKHQEHLLPVLVARHSDRWLRQPGRPGHREWICHACQHGKRLPELWPERPEPRPSRHLLRHQLGPHGEEGLDRRHSGWLGAEGVLRQESWPPHDEERALRHRQLRGPRTVRRQREARQRHLWLQN